MREWIVSTFLVVASSSYAMDLKSKVIAQCLDHTFSYYEYQFQIQVPANAEVKDPATLKMISDFSGHGSINSSGGEGDFDSFDRQTSEFQTVEAPWWELAENQDSKWRAQRKTFYMATGGYLSHLNFRFEWTQPDGSKVYEPAPQRNRHGQWELPSYRAEIFKLFEKECWHLRNPTELSYSIRKINDSEFDFSELIQ